MSEPIHQDIKPTIPEHMLKGLTPRDRWLYEQVSIHGQQNDLIIRRLDEGEKRFATTESKAAALEKEVEGLVRWKYWLMGLCAGLGFLGEKLSEWISGGHKH